MGAEQLSGTRQGTNRGGEHGIGGDLRRVRGIGGSALGFGSLDDFRRWALSDDFPETGRIDFIEGRIEVDMAPEDLFCHGTLKTEIVAALL